jgi:murein tripeptide amidase MpaA
MQNPTSNDLYNGNIRFMQTNLTDPVTRDAMPMLNVYQYDQLNRLLEARSYETGFSNHSWNPTMYNSEFFNNFTYDANDNILTQQHHSKQLSFNLTERNSYGSSRLGRNSTIVDVYQTQPSNSIPYIAGKRYYELSNHLGNWGHNYK